MPKRKWTSMKHIWTPKTVLFYPALLCQGSVGSVSMPPAVRRGSGLELRKGAAFTAAMALPAAAVAA